MALKEIQKIVDEWTSQFTPQYWQPHEIADIIFTLACLANSLDIDLDEAFDKVVKKYQKRDADRYAKAKPD